MQIVKTTQYGTISINYSDMTQTIRYRMKHDLFALANPYFKRIKVEIASTNYITFLAVVPMDNLDKLKDLAIAINKQRKK